MDNLVTITIQVSTKVMKRLEELAKEQNKTVSEIAQEIIEGAAFKDILK